MAVEGEEVDYESDPEDTPLPLMRRREASDDEDGDGSDDPVVRKDGIGSDGESDGQGAAQVYDDEEFDPEEDYDDLEEEEGGEATTEVEEIHGGYEEEGERGSHYLREAEPVDRVVVAHVNDLSVNDEQGEQDGQEGGDKEEKKEPEPYAVPTAGAFYMHDDRFRENGRGPHRRFPGGRRLWESKDDRAWVHDRFEELNLHDARPNEERRTSRGRFRGRGGIKNRGGGRGFARGNRSRVYDDNNNQNRPPKSVRGRGPRRYETLPKNRDNMPATTNKQYVKSHDSATRNSIGRQSSTSRQSHLPPAVQPDPAPRKNVFASSLSSASPPFYPSGSSNQDISMTHKKDLQTGMSRMIHSLSVPMEEHVAVSQSRLRGKATVNASLHDRVYVDGSFRHVTGKTSLSTSNVEPSHSTIAGRGITNSGPIIYQSTTTLNQVDRASATDRPSVVQQKQFQALVSPSLRVSTQRTIQRSANGIQIQGSMSSEIGDEASPPGSSKSKTSPTGKGQPSSQGAAKNPFLYGGAQVIGATGAVGFTHGDQSFPGTPALLPVMQFGAQHGGLGVPAVAGMALPGFVAQPQLGFGNSEMTWLPLLAGAAGASYPYITLDSNPYVRPSGQTSTSSVSSRESGTAKSGNVLLPSQTPEIVNEEFGQRQNKPRRYSEMSFGQ